MDGHSNIRHLKASLSEEQKPETLKDHTTWYSQTRGQPRGRKGSNCADWLTLADFWAEGDGKMYKTYRKSKIWDKTSPWTSENVAKLPVYES